MRRYRWSIYGAVGLLALVLSTCAFATDGIVPIDYSTALPDIQTQMSALLANAGVPLLGVLVVMLGFGLVWRLLKKAAKAV